MTEAKEDQDSTSEAFSSNLSFIDSLIAKTDSSTVHLRHLALANSTIGRLWKEIEDEEDELRSQIVLEEKSTELELGIDSEPGCSGVSASMYRLNDIEERADHCLKDTLKPTSPLKMSPPPRDVTNNVSSNNLNDASCIDVSNIVSTSVANDNEEFSDFSKHDEN